MEKEINLQVKESYITPDIEILEIETEQNILANGSGGTPDMAPDYW